MQRPVEINRKKSQLLLAALVALAGTAGLIWLYGSKGVTFSWKGVLDVIPIVLMGGTCLAAFLSLIVSLFSHEPYLLIYDDRIESSGAGGKTDTPISSFKRVFRTQTLLVPLTKGNLMYLLPTDAFIKGTAEECVRFFAAKGVRVS